MPNDTRQSLKPYDLVLVDRKEYGFCGQIISRPTDEGTIMVRRVPDDPATMEEMQISDLKQRLSAADYKWVHYAVVSGKLPFPVDMLRYDFATPVNFVLEEDRWGAKTVPTILDWEHWQDKLVIARCSGLKTPRWTGGRWNTFLWAVTSLGNPIRIQGK